MPNGGNYKPFPSFSEWTDRPVELRHWQDALKTLEAEREAASEEAIATAAEIVTRAAAVDTNAIEGLYDVDRGFTISVATHAAGWQAAFAEKGEKARSMFEAQMRAFELVLDAATNRNPITEALIRRIHEEACGPQAEYTVWTEVGWQEHALPHGRYKEHPNNPRTADGREHAYTPPEEVAPEMSRLVDELRSEAFERAAAPVQAAYAHYALAAVHPFADGNGRVARAVASIYLLRATSVPLLIFADRKPRYLDALAAADRGEYHRFTEHVRERSIDAMNLLVNGLQRAKAVSKNELQREARRLFFATGDFTHEQVDAAAERLLHEAGSVLSSVFAGLDLPEEIRLRSDIREIDKAAPPPGYRRLGRRDPPVLEIAVFSAPPANAMARAVVRPLVTRESVPSPVRLEVQNKDMTLDARVEDLIPEISSLVHLQLRTWLETLLVSMGDQVIKAARQSLEDSGWSR